MTSLKEIKPINGLEVDVSRREVKDGSTRSDYNGVSFNPFHAISK